MVLSQTTKLYKSLISDQSASSPPLGKTANRKHASVIYHDQNLLDMIRKPPLLLQNKQTHSTQFKAGQSQFPGSPSKARVERQRAARTGNLPVTAAEASADSESPGRSSGLCHRQRRPLEGENR